MVVVVVIVARASKGTLGDAKCVTEIIGGGDKNKEVGESKFKFDQLIIRKIIKIVATRCHILRQNPPNMISAVRLRPTFRRGSSQRSPDL